MDGDHVTVWEDEPTSDIRAAARAWSEGELVDERYRIEHRLGRGGMGIVFRAHDVFLDRTVALKALDADHCTPEMLERFTREARALAQVRHDNVCQIYAFGVHRDTSYFSMEHVEGRDLESIIQERVARGERTPLDEALAIVRQIARGLSAVHARGVVHRDVKPSNVIIEEGTRRAVLIDFGLARPAVEGERTSLVGGTPSYMPPEQATDANGDATGPRSDLYALACSVFELLTGRPPFEAETAFATLFKHIKDPPPPISTFRRELGPLDHVLLRAMSKAPQDRQASCEELVAGLEAAAKRVRAPQPAAITLTEIAPRARLRVLVVEADDSLRRNLSRIIDRTLTAAGDDVAIEHTADALSAAAAFEREPAAIVVVDDETVGGDGASLVGELRALRGGGTAEMVVLVRDALRRLPELAGLGARELPKPVNGHVLADVLTRIGTRIAERRAP